MYIKTNFIRRAMLGAIVLSLSCSNALADNSLRILDPATSPATRIEGVDDISDKAFRDFTKRTLATIETSFGDVERNEVTVIRIPVVGQGATRFKIPEANIGGDSSSCNVTSPWIDLSFKTAGGASLIAFVVWNERQVLLNLEADGSSKPPAPREPYRQQVFEKFADQYSSAMLSRETDTLLRSGFPSDLGALFKRAPQSTLIPFSENARAEMKDIASERVAYEAKIVERLVALCASGKPGNYRFSQVSNM